MVVFLLGVGGALDPPVFARVVSSSRFSWYGSGISPTPEEGTCRSQCQRSSQQSYLGQEGVAGGVVARRVPGRGLVWAPLRLVYTIARVAA